MGAIHKIGVAASLLLMVHATLCAIQRAPPRRLPSSPSLLTSDAPRRRSGLSEVDSRVIHDATRRGALRSRPACVPAHSDSRLSCCHRLSSSACLQPWVGSGACSGSRAAWCPFGRRRPSQSRPWTRCFLAWTSCTSTRGSSGNLVGVAPDSTQREGNTNRARVVTKCLSVYHSVVFGPATITGLVSPSVMVSFCAAACARAGRGGGGRAHRWFPVRGICRRARARGCGSTLCIRTLYGLNTTRVQ